jgi:hypothetical protein
MKRTILFAALMAAATFAMADEPGQAAASPVPLSTSTQDAPVQSPMVAGVLLTGATPSTASQNNPAPVVIKLDDGRVLLGAAVYAADNRYSVRGDRLLGPGGYPVDGFVVDSKHMEGVPGDKDMRLAPGTHISYVDMS